MAWNLTFLLVHLLALYAFGALYRRAPCWQQRLVMMGLIFAMLTLSISCAFSINGYQAGWHIFILGLTIEHIAVLLYAFRLVYREFLCLPNGSTRSQN